MPLTNAERKKRYLDRLKADGEYDSYRKKKSAGEKERRERIKNGLEQLPKAVRERTKRLNRDYSRKKMVEYRQRKKSQLVEAKDNVSPSTSKTTSSKPETGYKTASAESKAYTKLKRALPSTTAKKKILVKKLLRTFGDEDRREIVEDKLVEVKPARGINPSVIEMVKTFYERDDISRMSPNMKDCRKFVNPVTGCKEEKQIRHLMYKLDDVYNMFVRHVKNGDDTIEPPVKKSKFCELRPEHVKLVGSTPLETCFCIYHSNFIMCCSAINLCMPEFPKYGRALESLLLCEKPTKNCWLRVCSLCSNEKIRETICGIIERSGKNSLCVVKWHQWKKDVESNRFQKNVEKGTLNDLKNHFLKILPEFFKHSFTKRCQAASFEADNDEVRTSNGKVAIVQLDFAEGFNCEAQEEIQSAHWNQKTV